MLRTLTAGSLPPAAFSGYKQGRGEVIPNADRVLPMVDIEAAAKTRAIPQYDALIRNSREPGIVLVSDRFRMEK